MADVKKEDCSEIKRKPKLNNYTVHNLLQSFLSESSIHGLQKLQKSQRKPNRRFWIVSVVLIWFLVSAHFGILLKSFISNETSIDLRIVDARLLEFPAVTVCNANPIKKSALEALAANNIQLKDLLALDESEKKKKRRRRKRSLPTNTWISSYCDMGMEYYLSTVQLSYNNAIKQCRTIGTGMAKIVNKQMADAFLMGFSSYYMTDLNDLMKEGQFRHSDGREVIWTRWYPGQPDNRFYTANYAYSPADCAWYSEKGLYDMSCGSVNRFVCERNCTKSFTTTESGIRVAQSQLTVTESQDIITTSIPGFKLTKPTTVIQTEYSQPVTDPSIMTTEKSTISTPPNDNSNMYTHISSPLTEKKYHLSTSDTKTLTQDEISIYFNSSTLRTMAQYFDKTNKPTKLNVTERQNRITLSSEPAITPTKSSFTREKEYSLPGKASTLTENEYLTSSYDTRILTGDEVTAKALGLQSDKIETLEVSPKSTSQVPRHGTTSRLFEAADYCFSSPCKHGGTCITEGQRYSCICNAHYQGDQCQLGIVEEGGEDPAFKKAEKVTTILSNLPKEERTRIGYQVNDLLFYCRYNGRMCNMSSDFTQITNPVLGNCYTFNSKWQTSTTSRFLSTMSGRRHGLEIGINIGQSDMFKAAGGVAGAVVVVHPKDTMPFPEDYGTVLTPGVYNAIRIQKLQLNRLPYPYGDCIDTNTDASDRDVYITQYNITYSKTGCQKTCHQRHVIEVCGCALPYYPRYGIPFGDKNVSLCDNNDEKQEACKSKIEIDIAEDKLNCDCPNVCQEDIYIASKSSSQWPTKKRMNSVIYDMKNLFPNLFKIVNKKYFTAEENIIRDNFLKAAIFYDALSHEMINEVPQYTGFQFAGDVGGMLGLWIGVSALGIVQLMEFALKALHASVVTNRTSKCRVADSQPGTSGSIVN